MCKDYPPRVFSNPISCVQRGSLNGVVDEIRLQELFDQISYIAGEAMMEELNQRLKERFMIVPLVTAFAQGVSDDLIGRLTYRDPETSKQIFQLFMDTLE